MPEVSVIVPICVFIALCYKSVDYQRWGLPLTGFMNWDCSGVLNRLGLCFILALEEHTRHMYVPDALMAEQQVS